MKHNAISFVKTDCVQVLTSAFLHLCHRSLTAAAGFALGDVVAQHSTKPSGERYNYLRTARMTAFGLFFAGPLQGHYWYGWLDKVSPMLGQSSCRSSLADGVSVLKVKALPHFLHNHSV